ncbi:hypothetical protein RJ639_034596 [Escallonia herrerae]|uniref:Integrase catalytic domain-containing protein n=1 Tax=Escallonia herrerae TaxID=1293975 RepID=A0AA88WW42_9ASTE|nr:hypothetical protein RJ639_034596 [Escallonia herrerae]
MATFAVAFSTFKRLKALVKKQNGHQIKAMRSDRGVEFISKEFKAHPSSAYHSIFTSAEWSGGKKEFQQSKRYKLYNPVDKKMKSLWDWTDRDKEQYICYTIDTDRKEVEEEPIEPMTPSSPASQTQSRPTLSASSVDSPVKMGPQGKRSLEDIYDDLNQNQSMFCLFVDT